MHKRLIQTLMVGVALVSVANAQSLNMANVPTAEEITARIASRTNMVARMTSRERWESRDTTPPVPLERCSESDLLRRLSDDLSDARRRGFVCDDILRNLNATNVLDWVHWTVRELERPEDGPAAGVATMLQLILLNECHEGGMKPNRRHLTSTAHRRSLTPKAREVLLGYFVRRAEQEADKESLDTSWALQLHFRGLTNGVPARVRAWGKHVYTVLHHPPPRFMKVSLIPSVTSRYVRVHVEDCSKRWGTNLVDCALVAVSNIMSRTNPVLIADEKSWRNGNATPDTLVKATEGVLLRRMYEIPVGTGDGAGTRRSPEELNRQGVILGQDLYRNLNTTNCLDWMHWALLETMNCTYWRKESLRPALNHIVWVLISDLMNGLPEKPIYDAADRVPGGRKVLPADDRQKLENYVVGLANEGTQHWAGDAVYRVGITNGLHEGALKSLEWVWERRRRRRRAASTPGRKDQAAPPQK